jgi:hypothetical protein
MSGWMSVATSADVELVGPRFLRWALLCSAQDMGDAIDQAEEESIFKARAVIDAFEEFSRAEAAMTGAVALAQERARLRLGSLELDELG